MLSSSMSNPSVSPRAMRVLHTSGGRIPTWRLTIGSRSEGFDFDDERSDSEDDDDDGPGVETVVTLAPLASDGISAEKRIETVVVILPMFVCSVLRG